MVIIPRICKFSIEFFEYFKILSSSSGKDMALMQFCGFLVTIGVSLVGGLLTGLIIKLPCIHGMDPEEYFHDSTDWEMNNLLNEENES